MKVQIWPKKCPWDFETKQRIYFSLISESLTSLICRFFDISMRINHSKQIFK